MFGFRAQADTITADTAGAGGVNLNEYLGQSVLTGAGGPWNNITFAFLGSGGAGLAAGDLFVFNKAYTGTESGLISGAGLLAESTGIVNGAWTFASTLTLAANTEYYFYSDNLFGPNTVFGDYSASTYSNGMAYGAVPSYGILDFTADTTADANFSLTGTQKAIPAPEPDSIVLLGGGLLALAALMLSKKRAHSR
jgi:hypothetical protein